MTQDNGKYQTGDIHPIHNLSAFVEYDENGIGWWTSIATDPEAPFRLAAANRLDRECGKRVGSDIQDKSQRNHLPSSRLADLSERQSDTR